jgi:hypothetical protein
MEITKERALTEKLSNEQSAILAEEILQVHGKNEVPDKKVSKDEFCKVLAKLKHSIAKDFHQYDKNGRYTRVFFDAGLSEADLEIFKNSLINKASMIVAKNSYFTD